MTCNVFIFEDICGIMLFYAIIIIIIKDVEKILREISIFIENIKKYKRFTVRFQFFAKVVPQYMIPMLSDM